VLLLKENGESVKIGSVHVIRKLWSIAGKDLKTPETRVLIGRKKEK